MSLTQEENKQEAVSQAPVSKRRHFILYSAVLLCGFFAGKLVFNYIEKGPFHKEALAPSSFVKAPGETPSIPFSQSATPLQAPADTLAAPQEAASSLIVNEPSTGQTVMTQTEPAPGAAQVFVLNGIYLDLDGGCALVNNKIVKEGEMVGQAKVKKIGSQSVTLEFSGKTIEVSL